MTVLLKLDGVSASYGDIGVLSRINMQISRGGITAILGANGAGKTTLLRTIFNVLVRRQGRVQFEGEDITHLRTPQVVRLGITHVPDGRGTFAQLSVEDNLLLGGYTLGSSQLVRRGMDRVYDLFPRLKERSRQQAGTLSGGEQQMLAIGRALMPNPKLVLLDEPSFGLAPQIVAEIFKTLTDINQAGVSLLLVEQNAKIALSVASHVCLIETGEVIRSGPAEELQGDETVRKVYLGY